MHVCSDIGHKGSMFWLTVASWTVISSLKSTRALACASLTKLSSCLAVIGVQSAEVLWSLSFK